MKQSKTHFEVLSAQTDGTFVYETEFRDVAEANKYARSLEVDTQVWKVVPCNDTRELVATHTFA